MKNFYLLILCFISGGVLAQESDSILVQKKNLYSLAEQYQNGYVFPTNDFVRGANSEKEIINAYQSFSIKASQQTYGKNKWEQLFNYPTWGIGMSFYDFYNPEEIGNPIAFYGNFTAPFKRWDRLSFNYKLGLVSP